MRKEEKQLEQLKLIVSLTTECLDDYGSSTSKYFHFWCHIEERAMQLIQMIENGTPEPFLGDWIHETLATLRSHLAHH